VQSELQVSKGSNYYLREPG